MCDRSSIILHFKRRIRVKFQSTLIYIESMASKNTPKKLYQKRSESTGIISRCRLCNSVTDSKYCKNLFRDKNKTVLRNAECIYGEELLHSDRGGKCIRPRDQWSQKIFGFTRKYSEAKKSYWPDIKINFSLAENTAKTIKFTYINKLSSWLCHRRPHTMKKYGGYMENDSGLSDKTSPMWGDHHSLAGSLLFM